jgi:hypothetical protein
VFFFRNNGSGFAPGHILLLGTGRSVELEAADFNNDGRPDLASLQNSTLLKVHMNNGDGSFSTTLIPVTGVRDFKYLTISDIDNDGSPDIALAAQNLTFSLNELVLWFRNNDSGSFDAQRVMASMIHGNFFVRGVQFCDLDLDGLPELIVTRNAAVSSIA